MAFDKGFWKPNPKQELFLSLPWSVKEAFYGGGNGSGKSDVLLIYPLVHKLHENPNFKQLFQRRTYPELKKEIVPRSREIYSKFGATFNKTDMVWTFPRADQFGGSGMGNSGAMVFLGHCENEDDVHLYDSMEINLYTPDEITSFTEFIFLYIGYTRVRTSDRKLPAIIRGAGMPGGIGHTWFKKRNVDPAPDGSKIIIGKGGNKRFYVHSTLADNPHIDPDYAKALDALPEAERRARKFGDWNAYLGQVFDEFRDKRYPDEPENALHVVEPFNIPDWWPKIVIGDWGFRAQTYIMFGAISPSRRVYIYREQSFINTKIEEWAPYVREFIDKDEPRVIKFCKSVGYEQGQEHTIQEQIETALGRPIDYPNQGAGSRVAGKQLVHEYLRFKPKSIPATDVPVYSDEYASWLLRNKGLEAYKVYLAQFAPPEPETNLPKLQIFNTCPILINAIKACVYAKPKDNKPAEDVAEFDGDDPYDTLRYMLDTADSYFDESESEYKALQQRESVIERFQQTQDMTAFYRQMRTIEESSRYKPVRRYR